jgi:hypothetical protein
MQLKYKAHQAALAALKPTSGSINHPPAVARGLPLGKKYFPSGNPGRKKPPTYVGGFERDRTLYGA